MLGSSGRELLVDFVAGLGPGPPCDEVVHTQTVTAEELEKQGSFLLIAPSRRAGFALGHRGQMRAKDREIPLLQSGDPIRVPVQRSSTSNNDDAASPGRTSQGRCDRIR